MVFFWVLHKTNVFGLLLLSPQASSLWSFGCWDVFQGIGLGWALWALCGHVSSTVVDSKDLVDSLGLGDDICSLKKTPLSLWSLGRAVGVSAGNKRFPWVMVVGRGGAGCWHQGAACGAGAAAPVVLRGSSLLAVAVGSPRCVAASWSTRTG